MKHITAILILSAAMLAQQGDSGTTKLKFDGQSSQRSTDLLFIAAPAFAVHIQKGSGTLSRVAITDTPLQFILNGEDGRELIRVDANGKVTWAVDDRDEAVRQLADLIAVAVGSRHAGLDSPRRWQDLVKPPKPQKYNKPLGTIHLDEGHPESVVLDPLKEIQ